MDKYTAMLYDETNFICLILLAVILIRTCCSRDIRSKYPSLMGFNISLIILTVGDIFWAFVNGDIIEFTVGWGYFTNLVYFVGTLASVYFLFMLFLDTFGYKGDYTKKALLVSIPFIADLIFVFLTPLTHLVFYYEGNVYHRASMYVLTLVIPYIFVIYLCVASFVCSYRMKYFVIRRSLRIMTMYSAATLLLSFFQLISTNVFPLYVVGGTLISLMVYIDAIRELSSQDAVTRLQTHRNFENRLSVLMKERCDAGKSVCLILADIDDFKTLNSIYGNEEGNAVLTDLSEIVRKALPTGWFAGRFSDEVCAMAGIYEPESLDSVCTQLASVLDEYKLASSKPYSINIRLGYASLPYNCKSVGEFVKLAQRNLDFEISAPKRDKKAVPGENNTASGSRADAPITQQDVNLWMTSALKNGEFVPYYQPQIRTADGSISGAEALVRWIHPDRGLITPSVFIPVFERNGFIYEMDKAVWHAVCAQIRKWKDENIAVPPISVNVSRWDVVQNDFMQTLLSYLEEFRLDPGDLHLEITESAYLFDQEYLMSLMEKLQDLGFSIEMDDFGSGYSSLTAFKDLPFNLIKLDSSLVRESTKNEKAGTILEGVVRLTKSLGIPLIAEGVEYKEQAEFLKRIGCNYMQGYLFSKALPADKFIEFIKNHG